MHWVHDCYRASDVPNHKHFDEETLFEALSMPQIRKSDMELVATNSKAADPGKLKDERKWPEWEKAFTIYLSVIPGDSGIPLSYVIREQDEPTPGMQYSTFNERMVHRAPLTGQYYIADARRVHNLLVGFLQGENTEHWTRNIARYQDGRCEMTALRRISGEGNSTRRIADAKRIQNLLHYKTERALPFNKFLDSLQRMFTIFEEENEPLTERAKVDELLTKVQNTMLSAAVAQLRYQLNTVGISFTIAANHLNSETLQTSDYQLARKISAYSIGGRGTGRNGRSSSGHAGGRLTGRGRGGRGGRGGTNKKASNTGYYSAAEWEKLSYEERDKICKERDKKGEQGGTKQSILELTTKQLTTAIISSIQKAVLADDSKDADTASKKNNNQAAGIFLAERRA